MKNESLSCSFAYDKIGETIYEVISLPKRLEYDTTLHEIPEKGGAYVIFPWNIRELFGQGRVNMGLKNADGSICYVIGVLKSIREQLGKKDGDTLHVLIEERQ